MSTNRSNELGRAILKALKIPEEWARSRRSDHRQLDWQATQADRPRSGGCHDRRSGRAHRTGGDRMIRAFRRSVRQWWIGLNLEPSARVEHMTCVLVVAINGKKHAEWKLDCSRVRTHVDTIDALPDVWADGGQFLIDIPINLEVAAS